MSYKHITVTPIAPSIGAEVSRVDLASFSEETLTEIRQAFLEHHFLTFPDQDVPPEALINFGKHFGPLNVHPFLPHIDDHPEVMIIDKTEDKTTNVGNGWHTDMTFLQEPPLGSLLQAKIIPPIGGDTLFCNMYMAYDALSTGLKNLLDGLIAIHDYTKTFLRSVRAGRTAVTEDQIKAASKDLPPVEHPVIRTHPDTGRKLLFVNSFFTSHFKDMTVEESQPLLQFLLNHIASPEFSFRYTWRKNVIAFWDNRCTQHYAVNDYYGHRRLMYRVTVNGDRPV